MVIEVKPNTLGYLFKANVLKEVLSPGKYSYWDYNNEYVLISIPTYPTTLNVTNQDVLTKDQIALRFSFYSEYLITDGNKLLSQVDTRFPLNYLNQKLTTHLKLAFRDVIANLDCEELNEKRSQPNSLQPNFDELNQVFSNLGVTILSAVIVDLTFPKFIQELFSKQLESKIRSKTDLENARTAVATARTLKNASELVKGDDYIKFLQFMELISKVSEKGKHTFEISLKDVMKQ